MFVFWYVVVVLDCNVGYFLCVGYGVVFFFLGIVVDFVLFFVWLLGCWCWQFVGGCLLFFDYVGWWYFVVDFFCYVGCQLVGVDF